MVKIYIHADDFGLHNEITDKILDCFNNGVLNSTSIITNGPGFEYGVEKYKETDGRLRLALHLNLIEGKPLSDPEDIDLLIDSVGEYKYMFLALWLKYLKADRQLKQHLKSQIKKELSAQIDKYLSYVNVPLEVDSHMHMHMVPFISEILFELASEKNISYIRIPSEPFYFDAGSIKNYFSANIIKNLLLNYLSGRALVNTSKLDISCNKFFIGVLGTGNMSLSAVDKALQSINKKGISKDESIEILFHPGGIEERAAIDWTTKEFVKDYYISPCRKSEYEFIKSSKLKEVINKYEAVFNN
ncbi:MAG: carbohydrate deacetylase [Planctomycetota bacterium]|jgi:predicted glycoside hydrolase/deacetylase ChbG (UPF0249 family)